MAKKQTLAQAVSLLAALLFLVPQQVSAANKTETVPPIDSNQTRIQKTFQRMLEMKYVSSEEERSPIKTENSPAFEEIEEAAQFASNVTGVRKDFLMGLLVVETNLGKNTGKCTYSQVEAAAQSAHKKGQLSARTWNNFLKRKEKFISITSNLGYDYQQMRVSCNPSYAGTGGAMGIAQFMPDTWLEFENRTAQAVRKEKPDPWQPQDAVMAMALKLAETPGVTDHNLWSEKNAAKKYLSGNTSSKYNWYADKTIYWSKNYRSLYA